MELCRVAPNRDLLVALRKRVSDCKSIIFSRNSSAYLYCHNLLLYFCCISIVNNYFFLLPYISTKLLKIKRHIFIVLWSHSKYNKCSALHFTDTSNLLFKIFFCDYKKFYILQIYFSRELRLIDLQCFIFCFKFL